MPMPTLLQYIVEVLYYFMLCRCLKIMVLYLCQLAEVSHGQRMYQASSNIHHTTITTHHHMLASALVLILPLSGLHGEQSRPFADPVVLICFHTVYVVTVYVISNACLHWFYTILKP